MIFDRDASNGLSINDAETTIVSLGSAKDGIASNIEETQVFALQTASRFLAGRAARLGTEWETPISASVINFVNGVI